MSQNHVGGFYTSAIGFGWNEEVLKKKNLAPPRCWKDLLDPKYKGEIEISHPASSGTVIVLHQVLPLVVPFHFAGLPSAATANCGRWFTGSLAVCSTFSVAPVQGLVQVRSSSPVAGSM